MMKKLLFSMLVLTTSLAYSQSLEFVYQGKALENDAKVTVTDYDEDLAEMHFKALVRNKTGNDVEVIIVKEVVELPEGSSNNFCAGGRCYPDETMKSKVFAIAGNSENDSFHGVFIPTEASTAIIKYTAKVKGGLGFNSGDEVSVTVTYQYTPSGIEEIGYTELSITQNNDGLQIFYQNSEDTQLQVVDLLGRVKGSYKLSKNSNQLTLDLNDKKGIYLLVFINKNRKFMRKVILK